MIKPMLCKLRTKPFNDPNWIWERKWDGVRMLAFLTPGGGMRLQSRSGKDKTAMFPEIHAPVLGHAILDGEIVSADDSVSFQDFAQRRANRTEDVADMAKELPAKFMAFDILRLNEDLQNTPLMHRKELLNRLRLEGNVHVVETHRFGKALWEEAVANNWEGIVGKDLRGNYREGRRDWVKVKTWQNGTFYIVGFEFGAGKRTGLVGSLTLENKNGLPVGHLGTGFSDKQLGKLTMLMMNQPNSRMPIKVQYQEYTNEGQLRFPSYKGGLEIYGI